VQRRRPRALLLDVDETLVDNSGIPASVAQACEVVAAAVEQLDPRQLLEANVEVWDAYWPEVEEQCWLGRMDGFAVSRETWSRALRSCACTDESVVQFAFDEHLRLYRETLRLFSDVRVFLDHAAERGIRLGLVTNAAADVQHDKLRTVGLRDAFTTIVISGEVGMAKPDPALFHLALDRLDVDPQDAWHVGDSLTTDVAGARAAGIFAVWLNRDGLLTRRDATTRPDIEVASLSEVVELLRQAEPTTT
jgi:HAD superfamily hydrolase (TIGR01549 family)